MVNDPTRVMVRRIVAYLVDLGATFALAGALAFGMFMAISVEGTYEAPPAGVHVDGSGPGGCDEEREVVERVRQYGRRGRNRPNYRGDEHVVVTAVPDFCFDFGGGSVRYIEDGDGFSGWIVLSFITASGLNLALFQGLTGASVGKWLMGLRVVHIDGSRVRLGMATWRWVLLAFDSMCCFAPGLVMAFVKPGHQRLGDLGAASFVVDRLAAGELLAIPGVPGVTGRGCPDT